MGDEERAAIGRVHRKTPARGFPHHVDPELTPPPQEPPRPESLDGYDRIEPEVRDQLRLLADGLGSVTAGLGRLWDTRHDPARIDRLEAKIDGFSKYTIQHSEQLDKFVLPAIKAAMSRMESAEGRIGALLVQQERHSGQMDTFFDKEWPRTEKLIDGLAVSLRDLVDRFGRIETSLTGLSARVTAVEGRDTALEQRVTALELRNRDADAGDRRQAKLFSLARVVFVGVVGVVGFVGSQLGNIADWFRK